MKSQSLTKHKFNNQENCNYIYTEENLNSKRHRKIRSEMYDLKKRNKIRANIYLKNFHKNILLRKYQIATRPMLSMDTLDTSCFFITKTDDCNYVQTTCSSNSRNNGIKSLKLSCNFQPKTARDIRPKIINTHSTRFNSKISNFFDSIGLSSEKTSSISQFYLHTDTYRNLKLSQKNIKESYFQKIEDQKNQIENYEVKLYLINQIRRRLTTYCNYLSQYLSFLNGHINEEKKKLDAFSLQKSNLEISLQNINKKIENNKKILLLYKNYKKFLLMVKFKVKDLTSIPNKYLQYYGINEYFIRKSSTISKDSPKIIFSPNRPHNNLASRLKRRQTRILIEKPNRGIAKKSTIAKNLIDVVVKTEENESHGEKKIKNIPIFENVEEFVENIKSLQDHTFDLFKIFSGKVYQTNLSTFDKDKMSVSISNIEKMNDKMCETVEIELNKIKKRNEKLQIIYDNIRIIPSGKDISQIIFDKEKSFLLSLPINIEIDFNIVNFYKILNTKGPIIFLKGNKYNKILYTLKIVENLFINYISINKQYRSRNKKTEQIYNEIISNLTKDKKNQKNKMLKEQEILKIEKRNQEIINKNKKIIFLSNKNLYNKGEMIIKISKSKKKNNDTRNLNHDELTNEEKKDMLTY